MHSDKNNKKNVQLEPKGWIDKIENCKWEYEKVKPDSKEYEELFKDKDTKIPFKKVTEEGSIQLSISELVYGMKVFRINNMRLFTAFNSVLHFYRWQNRMDLCKLEYVYYHIDRCYGIERIINGKFLH